MNHNNNKTKSKKNTLTNNKLNHKITRIFTRKRRKDIINIKTFRTAIADTRQQLRKLKKHEKEVLRKKIDEKLAKIGRKDNVFIIRSILTLLVGYKGIRGFIQNIKKCMGDIEIKNVYAGKSICTKNIQLGQKISNGAYGNVYEGTYNKKSCALKQIEISCNDYNENLKSVKTICEEIYNTIKEKNILQQMNTHKITPAYYGYTCCFDPVQMKFIIYIAMERVQSSTLKEYLETHKRTLNTKEKQKLKDAFSVLHKNGIIHGDVHTGNIMYDGKQFRILDFGYARTNASASREELRLIDNLGKKHFWTDELSDNDRLVVDTIIPSMF